MPLRRAIPFTEIAPIVLSPLAVFQLRIDIDPSAGEAAHAVRVPPLAPRDDAAVDRAGEASADEAAVLCGGAARGGW